jgi:hypothetical protein
MRKGLDKDLMSLLGFFVLDWIGTSTPFDLGGTLASICVCRARLDLCGHNIFKDSLRRLPTCLPASGHLCPGVAPGSVPCPVSGGDR